MLKADELFKSWDERLPEEGRRLREYLTALAHTFQHDGREEAAKAILAFLVKHAPITQHFPLVDKLHTDVLEEKYGPISAQVIRHDDRIREAHLVDKQGISRTYAVTLFPDRMPSGLAIVDADIRKGAPIGKAFRQQGYVIRKNVIDVYVINLPEWLRAAFHVSETKAKVRLSEFYARKAVPEIYGVVAEVYSPDFRPAIINQTDIAQVSAPTTVLESRGMTKEMIWERISGNDWNDKRIADAKKESAALISSYRKRVLACISATH